MPMISARLRPRHRPCGRRIRGAGGRRATVRRPGAGVASRRCRRGADTGRSWPWPRRSWPRSSSTPSSPRSSTFRASTRTRFATRSRARRWSRARVSPCAAASTGSGRCTRSSSRASSRSRRGLAAAYDLFKAANALFFALTAIPVYLLARRLVSEWWAVLAAALSVAIPSSISVATVMTESLAFFTAAWALYAIMLALERPTTARQLALLAAVAAAFLTRPQFGALYVTWLLGLCARLADPAGEATADARRPRSGSGRAPCRSCSRWESSRAASCRAAPRESPSARTGSSGAATTRSRWRSGSSTTSRTSRSTSRSYPSPSRRSSSGACCAKAGPVPSEPRPSPRSSSRRTRSGCSWSRPSTARPTPTTGSTTATRSTSSRSGSSCSSPGLPTACPVRSSRRRPASSSRSRFRRSCPSASSRTRPESTPCRARSGSGSSPRRQGLERSRAEPCSLCSSSGSSRLASSCRARFRLSCPWPSLAVFAATAVFAWERMIDAPENAVLDGGLEPAWIDELLPDDARVTKLYLESDGLPRLEPHPPCAVRDRVLQRHGRPGRLHRRLDPRRDPARPGRGRGRTSRLRRTEPRSSRTSSTRSRASSSAGRGLERHGRRPRALGDGRRGRDRRRRHHRGRPHRRLRHDLAQRASGTRSG